MLNQVRVLVVDDSNLIRKRLIEMLLDASELDVEEACDTAEALRILERTPVDVVVLDMHIGPNSSLDFIPVVKRHAPRVAVLVLTNDASDAHRRACLLRGADYFFDKSRQFENALEVVLAHRNGGPAIAALQS
jgi:DNA-binding NarL/FixJ family response regulator